MHRGRAPTVAAHRERGDGAHVRGGGTSTGQHLALKVMLARSLLAPADLVERFRREAQIHGAVKSDHVVRVVNADVASELDDAPFLVMGLFDGATSNALVRRTPEAGGGPWVRLSPAGARAGQGAPGRDHPSRPQAGEPLPGRARGGFRQSSKILSSESPRWGAKRTAMQPPRPGKCWARRRCMAPGQARGAEQVTAAANSFELGLIAFHLLSGPQLSSRETTGSRCCARWRARPQARPSAEVREIANKGVRRLVARACADVARKSLCHRGGTGGGARRRGNRRASERPPRPRANLEFRSHGLGALVATIWAVAHARTAASPPALPRQPAPVTTLAAPPTSPPQALQLAPPIPPWEDSARNFAISGSAFPPAQAHSDKRRTAATIQPPPGEQRRMLG